MNPIISRKKNNRHASIEAESNNRLLETVNKMRVSISLTKTDNHRGTLITLTGSRCISDLISTHRAHFALEGHKLYIIPSMAGYWLPRANGWSTTLSNVEIVDALMPYIGAKYPVAMELMELAGIPDFPMYYINLNKPEPIHKNDPLFKQVNSQLYYTKCEGGEQYAE